MKRRERTEEEKAVIRQLRGEAAKHIAGILAAYAVIDGAAHMLGLI